MKEVFSVTLVIIGALIGAGFASGQEIYSFFYSYGEKGFIGIITTCVLMAILINKTLKIVTKYQINNYNELLELFVKNNKINEIINTVINILLLITFYIMIAGFGAYFEQEIGISKIIGSCILAIMCYIVLLGNIKGVLKVSEYIVPILIISILIIGITNLTTINNAEITTTKNNWILSSITYCSYNMILLVPVLISLRKLINKEKSIKYISICSGIIMLVLSIMIYTLLMKSDVDISTLEMPVVYIVRKFFAKFKIIYAFIILASIFTTAISIGTGFLQNICKKQKSYPHFVLLMCITSIVVANFGFSKLVNLAYPIFGYLGIIQIFCLLKTKLVI